MERMGDILAKNATRRARLRAGRTTDAATSAAPPGSPAAASGGSSSGVVRTPPVQRGAITTPLARRSLTRGAPTTRAGTPAASTPPPAAPAPARPQADALSVSPAAPAADVAGEDRILELPRRSPASGHLAAGQRVASAVSAAPAQTEPGMALAQSVASGARSRVPAASQRPGPGRPGTRPAMTPLADVAQGFVASRMPRRAGGVPPSQPAPAARAREPKTATPRASTAPDVCPRCGGAGYVRLDVPVGDPTFGQAVPCTCKERQKEERRRSDLRRLSSLDPFVDKTFETFDQAVPGVREAFEVAQRFAEDPQGWLMLSGSYGAGKTHLAAAIANARLAAGSPVFFSIVPDLLDHLRAAFAPTSDITYDEMFDKVREAELLVLDDLGAENGTAWATEKLFQLINYRYNFRMPTVITTNNRLLAHMDERIRSRLLDLSLVRHVAIEAQDYRERRAGRAPRAQAPGGGASRGRGYTR
jgi:DNA replication protein DnaC